MRWWRSHAVFRRFPTLNKDRSHNKAEKFNNLVIPAAQRNREKNHNQFEEGEINESN
jgi:hypothetical protein